MKRLLLAVLMIGALAPLSYAYTPLRSNEAPKVTRVSAAPTKLKAKSGKPADAPLRVKARAEASDEVITTAPEGTTVTLCRKGLGTYSSGFYAEVGSDDGFITELVKCADGTVYLKNPMFLYPTESYMKGRIEGDEMIFELPQLLEVVTDEDDPEAEPMMMYATVLTGTENEEEELEFTPADGPCEIRYKIDGDSFGRTLDEVNYTMLGLIWDEYWMDYGELEVEYTPFTTELVQAPSDLATERWACTYGGDGHYVNVGFTGDDVYIQGIAPSLPDTWIKGSVAAGKVTLPSGQFVGVDPEDHHSGYFYGATMALEEDPDWGDMVMTPHMADNLTLDYDAETKTMKTEDAALINAVTTRVYYIDLLDKPIIRLMSADGTCIPNDPVILQHIPASVLGTGAVQFDLPRTSTEGAILDTDKMFYNVFFDGELAQLLEEETDIPWNYSDGWDFSVYGITHEAYYYDTAVQAVGIQNCYNDGKEVKKSAIVYTDGTVVPAGLGTIEDASDIVSIRYTDLLGRSVAKPASGIYIRTTVYSDGSARTIKKVVR